VRVVRPWHRFPREAVAAPSLAVFEQPGPVEGVPAHVREVGTR